MIGDFILWQKRVWREMFCIHNYEWRKLSDEDRKRPGDEFTIEKLVCKKCGRYDWER